MLPATAVSQLKVETACLPGSPGPRLPGVDANGNWDSGVLDDCQAAFAAASAHEHTVDRVEAITGPVGIAINGC